MGDNDWGGRSKPCLRDFHYDSAASLTVVFISLELWLCVGDILSLLLVGSQNVPSRLKTHLNTSSLTVGAVGYMRDFWYMWPHQQEWASRL